MEIKFENDTIYLNMEKINELAYTDYSQELYETIANTNWTIKANKQKTPKYLYSSKIKKSLHQVVIDHFWGEDFRKEAYKNHMVIEHLDGNGFNCKISNLSFLHRSTNWYKGQHFDVDVRKLTPDFSLRIFNIIDNRTYQITIAFNETYAIKLNDKFHQIDYIKLLYKCDYNLVFQDAETILYELKGGKFIDLYNRNHVYRFVDFKYNFSKFTYLTPKEKKLDLKAGNFVWRNGDPCILMGDTSRFMLTSIGYEKDWS